MGTVALYLDVAFKAFARVIWPEPVRYAVSGWRLSRLTRSIDRQIASARRRHKSVAHLIAAKRSLIHSGLRGQH